jgi:hypothetical protein
VAAAAAGAAPAKDQTSAPQPGARLSRRSDAELDELVREAWGQVGAVLAEYPHLGAICARDRTDRIETVIRFDRAPCAGATSRRSS